MSSAPDPTPPPTEERAVRAALVARELAQHSSAIADLRADFTGHAIASARNHGATQARMDGVDKRLDGVEQRLSSIDGKLDVLVAQQQQQQAPQSQPQITLTPAGVVSSARFIIAILGALGLGGAGLATCEHHETAGAAVAP